MARENQTISNEEPLTDVINEALSYLSQNGQQVKVKQASNISNCCNTMVNCQDDVIIITSKEIILPRRKVKASV